MAGRTCPGHRCCSFGKAVKAVRPSDCEIRETSVGLKSRHGRSHSWRGGSWGSVLPYRPLDGLRRHIPSTGNVSLRTAGQGQAFGVVVDTAWDAHICIGVPGFESLLCVQFQLSAYAHSGRQQVYLV